MPVLQGWYSFDHAEHVERYARRGIDLRKAARVGVGSICRRQQTLRAGTILAGLAADGLALHGFGFKLSGLRLNANLLASADSIAWSFHERRESSGQQNRLHAALAWRNLHIEPILREADRSWRSATLGADGITRNAGQQLSLPWNGNGEHSRAA